MVKDNDGQAKQFHCQSLIYEIKMIPETPSYSHSLKLEGNLKGVRISVHVYPNGLEKAIEEAFNLYHNAKMTAMDNNIPLTPVDCKRKLYHLIRRSLRRGFNIRLSTFHMNILRGAKMTIQSICCGCLIKLVLLRYHVTIGNLDPITDTSYGQIQLILHTHFDLALVHNLKLIIFFNLDLSYSTVF